VNNGSAIGSPRGGNGEPIGEAMGSQSGSLQPLQDKEGEPIGLKSRLFLKKYPKHFYLKTVKARDVIKALEIDGWYLVRTRGSHRQFKHPEKLGIVTVPGKLSKDLAIGTLRSIWRQAQMEDEL